MFSIEPELYISVLEQFLYIYAFVIPWTDRHKWRLINGEKDKEIQIMILLKSLWVFIWNRK